jgi:hypothetical protein
MHTITWKPNTLPEYDTLFETLRNQQYQNREQPLWQNYTAEHFQNECSALSIGFNDNNEPEYCGSILSRDCWPAGVYRILNRFWRINQVGRLVDFSPISKTLIDSQIQWVSENTDGELVFISRENRYWQRWGAKKYMEQFNLEFKYNANRYLTCDNTAHEGCWQYIIYHGNEKLLDTWKNKQ